MTDYTHLQNLLANYDTLANVERGYNGMKVESAFQAFSAECGRLGVSVTEGRRLAEGRPAIREVEVQGPAYVLSGSRRIIVCETREGMEAADPGFRYVQSFIPAGKSQSFAVAA